MSTSSREVLIDISEPYPFSKQGLKELEQNRWINIQWPIVYFIKNGDKKIGYIGESANALARIKSHLMNSRKAAELNQISIIGSDRFNKSATLDIESSLIQYVSAEGTFTLQNGNYGLLHHHYYEQELYKDLFRQIWAQLMKRKVVKRSLAEIENSQVFKYSPYKSLNEDQYLSVLEILQGLTTKRSSQIFVEGSAGTGKTILATYLVKLLKSDIKFEDDTDVGNDTLEEVHYIKQFQKKYPDAKIAMVVAMKSLRKTLKNVFSQIPGLTASMVLSPSETFNLGHKYDLLIVDEAHRLRKYRNISWRGAFRKNNRRLGLEDSGTELDWILANSKNQIFFYDRDQSIRPSDIDESRFEGMLNNTGTLKLALRSQMRVMGGVDYINFVDELLSVKRGHKEKYSVKEYELLVFDRLRDMRDQLAEREHEYKLCRMIAGFAWPWLSKKNKKAMDIEIEGLQFQWNVADEDWINSPTAANEIGCIHTTMGYDLNYAGVIFGREIKYNQATGNIEIDADSYFDSNGKNGISNPERLKSYIISIYKNMMYRGIRGTFVYACDPALRAYLKQHIPAYEAAPTFRILSTNKAIRRKNVIPFLDIYAAASDFSQPQTHEELQWIELPFEITDKDSRFVCKVVGESMNKVIPNGSLCLFRRDDGGTREGKIVLVQSTHIQDAEFGSGYTIKEYHSIKYNQEGSWAHRSIMLKPLSYDTTYKTIELADEALTSFKVIGIFERLL
jgi:DUF2075 family protein/DNA replication protein DnaC